MDCQSTPNENPTCRGTAKYSSSKTGTVRQIFQLLIEKKAWWLIPMVTVFLMLGLLIVLTQGSALSPFIYALF